MSVHNKFQPICFILEEDMPVFVYLTVYFQIKVSRAENFRMKYPDIPSNN